MWDLLFYSEIFLAIVFSIVAIIQFKQLSRGFQYLTFLMIISALSDLLGTVLIKTKVMSTNMHFWTAYQIFAIILIGLTFYFFARTQIVKNLALVLSSILFITKIIFITRNGIYAYDNIGYGLSHLTWIIFSIVIFFEIFHFADQDNLLEYPLFWVVCGFLIYCSGTLFLHILQNFEIWIVHNIILIIKYILFSKGLWEELKTKSSLVSSEV